jgi:hypothetical protein
MSHYDTQYSERDAELLAALQAHRDAAIHALELALIRIKQMRSDSRETENATMFTETAIMWLKGRQ